MWTTIYAAETTVAAPDVWAALRDLHTGGPQSADGDVFELHGPFQVGSEISVTPQGQETFRSRITELVENERYADVTTFGDLTLTFRHTLTPIDSGTRVSHELIIDGPSADEAGPELGSQISADFPAAMASLFELAAGLAATRGQ